MPRDAIANIFKVEMKVGPIKLGMYGLGWREFLSATDLVEPLFKLVDLFWLERSQVPNSRAKSLGLFFKSDNRVKVVAGIVPENKFNAEWWDKFSLAHRSKPTNDPIDCLCRYSSSSFPWRDINSGPVCAVAQEGCRISG